MTGYLLLRKQGATEATALRRSTNLLLI